MLKLYDVDRPIVGASWKPRPPPLRLKAMAILVAKGAMPPEGGSNATD
jgi:hypothetical protein